MNIIKKILVRIIDILSGEVFIRKRWDRHLPFIVWCAVLIIAYMTWGLWVEDQMALIVRNEAIIEEKKIEYYQLDLKLISLDKRSTVESLLLKHGNKTLAAPIDPPKTVLVE
jgi:hypothetical protein